MDEVFERVKARRINLQSRRQKLLSALTLVEQEIKEIDSFFAVAAKHGAAVPPLQSDDPPRNALLRPVPPPWLVTSLIGDAGLEASGSKNALSAFAHWSPPPPAQHGSKRKVIVDRARETIRRFGPLSARRMLEFLDAEGVGALIPGRDEKQRVGYLSAVLSKEPMFKSDRDLGGYVLVEEVPPTEGQEGPNT